MRNEPKTTVFDSRESWMEARAEGLGSSDAPVILGVSKWKTPLQLWAEKSGVIPAEKVETQAMKMGLKLEPLVAELYAEETGRPIEEPGLCIVQSADTPWLMCSPDRYTTIDATRAVLELKTSYTRDGWEDGPPDIYTAQVQHQLAATGLSRASIAVLVAGRDFLWCDIERNEAFIENLLDAERDFMRRITENDPPDPTYMDLTTLKALYPEDTGRDVALDDDAADAYAAWIASKESVKQAEAERDAANAKLLSAIGDATFAALPDGRVLSCKTIRIKEREVPARFQDAYSYRTIREVKSRG